MIPAITRQVNNFFRGARPQRGRPLSTTTHAVAAASLAVIGYVHPSLAIGGAMVYAVSAAIWNRTLGRPRVAPAQAVNRHVPAGGAPADHFEGDIGAVLTWSLQTAKEDAEMRRALELSLEFNEPIQRLQPDEIKESTEGRRDVEDVILLDGSMVPPAFQVSIRGKIYSGVSFVKAMLVHRTIRHAVHGEPLAPLDEQTLCNFLKVPVGEFRNVWAVAEEGRGDFQAQLTAEITLELEKSGRYRELRAQMAAAQAAHNVVGYGRLSDQIIAMQVNATEGVEERANEYGQTRRNELLKALLARYNSKVVLD